MPILSWTISLGASPVSTPVTGTYGSITIAADGSYTYTVDNNNVLVQGLRTTASTLSDVFTYTVRDSQGFTSTAQVNVTIQGANDAPNAIRLTSGSGTNLVVNGSFEQNNQAGSGAFFGTNVTVDNWTAIGGEGLEIWENWGATPSDGTTLIEIDGAGAVSGISQNINTSANQTYSLQFDLRSRQGGQESVDAYWRGEYLGKFTVASGSWHTFSVSVTGSGGADELRFMELASENDALGSHIDNVRLFADQSTAISIAEDSPNGTVVARATGIDPDRVFNETIAYSLTDNAGGRFAIDATTGLITVADTSLFNINTATSHDVTVRVTDSAGLTHDDTFTVHLTSISELNGVAISDINPLPNVILENATGGTSVGVHAGPQVQWSESFDGLAGIANGNQYLTGYPVQHSASLPGWTASGLNALHVVETGESGADDRAIMIFGNNVATNNVGLSVNDAGQSYSVDLRIASAVYQNSAQATTAADGVVVQLLRADNSVLASHTFLPGAFSVDSQFQTVNFQYTGDGSGDVRIRLVTV